MPPTAKITKSQKKAPASAKKRGKKESSGDKLESIIS
jgi:hypothetical protein